MIISNINESKAKLSQLIKRALAGDDIIIARGNEPLVRLVPISRNTSPRVGGQWAGLISIEDNFEFTEHELSELFHAPINGGLQ